MDYVLLITVPSSICEIEINLIERVAGVVGVILGDHSTKLLSGLLIL
jgi:hypothetical protein